MSITKADVAEILKLLDESGFDELALETGDLKIRLRRTGATGSAQPREETRATPQPANAAQPARAAEEPGIAAVPAPMLGTFYRSPKPTEPPFVEVGQHVEEDTIIGIIEVMKLMNTVRAGVRGEVIGISARNAMLVEYGETLIRVRKN